ncbi:hypothetical protein SZ64_06005 [Erythrobacter sp. SG61-1L]|nr:hypothetical protein SZ64_06005 [Erythrobacter sp. SG61-1L]
MATCLGAVAIPGAAAARELESLLPVIPTELHAAKAGYNTPACSSLDRYFIGAVFEDVEYNDGMLALARQAASAYAGGKDALLPIDGDLLLRAVDVNNEAEFRRFLASLKDDDKFNKDVMVASVAKSTRFSGVDAQLDTYDEDYIEIFAETSEVACGQR